MNQKILQEIKKIRSKTTSTAVKNLPAMFFFTDRKRVADIFSVIQKLPKNTAVIIREYDLSTQERLEFSQKIIRISKPQQLKIFVGKDLYLAKKIKADGVHFSDFTKNIKSWQIPKNMLISYSCHSIKSVTQAKNIKANLVFYSPIFKSDSHPNQKPSGIYTLRKFAKQNPIATYALGGINQKNIKSLNNTNISGIGGISIF